MRDRHVSTEVRRSFADFIMRRPRMTVANRMKVMTTNLLSWPALPFRGMEGNLRHAPHVDADRRQNPAGPLALDESFLARHALSDRAWPNDFADSARRAHFRDRFRFRRSRSAHHERATARADDDRAGAASGRRILPRSDERSARTRICRSRSTRRRTKSTDAIPFDQDETHRVLRSGICEPFLARSFAERSRLQGISLRAFAANAARSIFSGAASIWP